MFVQSGGVIVYFQMFLCKLVNYQWINCMFLSLYVCGDIIFVVVGKNWYFCLENDWVVVEFVCYEMY